MGGNSAAMHFANNELMICKLQASVRDDLPLIAGENRQSPSAQALLKKKPSLALYALMPNVILYALYTCAHSDHCLAVGNCVGLYDG
jgi:hypothetical protein